MSLITCLQDCYFSSFTVNVIFTLTSLFINKQYISLYINIKYDCEIHLNVPYMCQVYKYPLLRIRMCFITNSHMFLPTYILIFQISKMLHKMVNS